MEKVKYENTPESLEDWEIMLDDYFIKNQELFLSDGYESLEDAIKETYWDEERKCWVSYTRVGVTLIDYSMDGNVVAV